MSATITRTLEATLAPPTAHKGRKLRRLLKTYRDALRESFEANCTTMSAVNDIVTGLDLPYQAKDALKRYVPSLHTTYGAGSIDDRHPIRFVNRAAKFDHDPTRAFSFCWRVPQPGRGTSFWIPIRINPDQRDLWNALLNGDADPGELRLQNEKAGWVLHVTVTLPLEDSPSAIDDRTKIGLDIGESTLVTGCALVGGTPSAPMLCDGAQTRRLRKEMHTTLKRLQSREAAEWRIDERVDRYQNALTDTVEKASRRTIEYASGFQKPLIVMEDLSYIRRHLNYGSFMNRRLHSWAFSRLQSRIEDKARDAGIPIRHVRPEYTSKICHACKYVGSRPSQATFRCNNEECHVTDFQADINAAANIARRVDPWGESVPWKTGRDDSPRDGSPRDRAIGHAEGAPSG